MKTVLFAIYTEYQLLLAINEVLTRYASADYQCSFLIKRSKNNGRLSQELNLSSLPVEVIFWDHDLDVNTPLPAALRGIVATLTQTKWDTFIYFQEEDPLTVLLATGFQVKGTNNYLYQDGLKPYNPLKSRSLGQVKGNIRQTLWLWKNGFKIDSLFSFLYCHKYAFLNATSKVFLTFPEAYNNWNNKPIEKIAIKKNEALKRKLEEVFLWDDVLMGRKEKTIFFVSQFMRDDGTFELMLLAYLINRFPEYTIYIKFHPLTLQWDMPFVDKVRALGDVHDIRIIDSKIPAELFIMQLTESIVISSISTSMFLDNPACRFYYTYDIAQKYIPRFGRYNTINPTPHVKTVQSFEEIE